jgi:hypothetical protein
MYSEESPWIRNGKMTTQIKKITTPITFICSQESWNHHTNHRNKLVSTGDPSSAGGSIVRLGHRSRLWGSACWSPYASECNTSQIRYSYTPVAMGAAPVGVYTPPSVASAEQFIAQSLTAIVAVPQDLLPWNRSKIGGDMEMEISWDKEWDGLGRCEWWWHISLKVGEETVDIFCRLRARFGTKLWTCHFVPVETVS